MRKIRIQADQISAVATLDDNPTADAIWKALPIEAKASTWGDEIYFEIPVYLQEADDALETVRMGDLGYWPTGHAFCIFFGPTPVSRGDEIRPASAVNVFGRVEDDPTVFKSVGSGDVIVIKKTND